jgi:glutathione S-transferase
VRRLRNRRLQAPDNNVFTRGIAMKWTAWTTLAALTVYLWVFANAGRARGKHKVLPPSMEGPLEFQSAQRIQANTVEQIVLFLPALWLCAYFFSDRWAALGGVVWVAGRILYALGYYKDPSKRGPGFVIAFLANLGLMLGAAAGLLMR